MGFWYRTSSVDEKECDASCEFSGIEMVIGLSYRGGMLTNVDVMTLGFV